MAEGSFKTDDEFRRLVEIMKALRAPETGCPWDLEQDFESIAPYTIEEAYEVADAIARDDMKDLCEELGDLLLQVVFHAQIASEKGAFDISDVSAAINDKMIRRHPHVFGQADAQMTAGQQKQAWEDIKAAERAEKGDDVARTSALDGIALALPALVRAEKLQKRAARSGFDWSEPAPIFDKLEEEVDEVREAIAANDPAHIEEEIGDLLFVVTNLARRLSVDPETALRKANLKFEGRFRAMEDEALADGNDFGSLSLDEQERLWSRVKRKQSGA